MEIINQLLTWHGTNEMWLQSESVTTNNFLIAGDNNNDSINDEDLAINNPTVIRCSTSKIKYHEANQILVLEFYSRFLITHR